MVHMNWNGEGTVYMGMVVSGSEQAALEFRTVRGGLIVTSDCGVVRVS